MMSSTSLASVLALIEDDDFDILRLADREDQFRTKTQQPVLVGDHQPPGLPVQNLVKQAFETFFVVVHARAQIGYDFERPSLLCAVQFQHLFLPFQVVPLVMAGDVGIGNRLTLIRCDMERLRFKLNQVVATMTAGGILRDQPSLRLPTPNGCDRHAEGFRRLADAHQSLHIGEYKTDLESFQPNYSNPFTIAARPGAAVGPVPSQGQTSDPGDI